MFGKILRSEQFLDEWNEMQFMGFIAARGYSLINVAFKLRNYFLEPVGGKSLLMNYFSDFFCSRFRLLDFQQKKSQWKNQAVNGVGSRLQICFDRTSIIFRGHQLTLINVRLEEFTCLRTNGPFTTRASI